MKLDIPLTWETQLSAKGNKKEVWEDLILSNSLPYMAMLRNLRNILKVGISDIAHQKVIDKLCDAQLIKGAKIFPLQYFSALVEVDKMLKLTEINKQEEQKNSFEQQEEEKDDKIEILSPKILQGISQFGLFYKEAINKAINLSVEHNLELIKGLTVIFADVSGSMCCPISGEKRYGSVRTCKELALLLGLMIRNKCQNCDFYLFSSPNNENKCYLKVKQFKENDYLENMQFCNEESEKLGGGTDFPIECIQEYQKKNIKIDNIIILSDMMISQGFLDITVGNLSVSSILNQYKNSLNPDLKIFSVDLRGYQQKLNLGDEFTEKNYIRIFGMSDSILRFISLRETSQMQEIEDYAEIKVAEYQQKLIK